MLLRGITLRLSDRTGLSLYRTRLTLRAVVVIILAASIWASIASMAVRDAHAETNLSRSGNHVLTVYDGGRERGLLTDAKTLGAALEQAGIKLNQNDISEPAIDEKLTAATYDVNIYRARPISIHDGASVKKVMSPYHSAPQIAKQANITLHDEDAVRLESSLDVVSDGAIERLVIDRATPITFVFYGKTSTVYTQAGTVGEMLKAKDISLGEKDKLSVKSETPIKADMKVEIWREGKQTITEEESVAFPVRQIEDANREVGSRQVKTPGTKGERIVTYEVVIKNGEEVSRNEIKSITTKEPKEQVEVVGTKPGDGLTKSKGAHIFVDSNGVAHRETYYDLPMSVVMGSCGAGGNYTIRADGAKIDAGGYVIIAANLGNYPRCSVVETSIGPGKVYDTGGFAAYHPHGFDLATDWTNYDGI